MDSGGLVRLLRRVRPAQLTAVSSAGERRAIAVPAGRRKKWDHVLKTLTRLDWITLELADKDGALLEVVDGREDPDGAVEVAAMPDARTAGNLELMLRAQEVALMRHERGIGQVLNAYQALVATFAERLSSLERSYASVLQMAHDAATAAAAAAPSPDDALVASMAPAILQRFTQPTPKVAK